MLDVTKETIAIAKDSPVIRCSLLLGDDFGNVIASRLLD